MAVKLIDRSPITSADVLITIEGVPGYFSKFSGIKKKFSRAMYSDGLSNTKRPAASGSIEFENVTIAKAHDPEKDDELLQWIAQHECGEVFNMSLRPVKRCNGLEFRGNKVWNLSECRLAEVSIMDSMDTEDGSKVSEISITFSYSSAVLSGANTTSNSGLGI
ncbi:MAG: hypothetical protein KME13_18485 [Myxacorys californica WJT36-NPBG1]|jgi:hypothetical protein|nr:hypothetical protein [Myxacorys californica WJT36-NPBG1]